MEPLPNTLKDHSGSLVKTENKKEEIVLVDEAKKLKEIRSVVESSNQSSLSNDLIICQIYMESQFNKRNRENVHNARGLMQLQRDAVREIYVYRKRKI